MIIMAKSPNWEPPADFRGIVLYPDSPSGEPQELKTGPKPGVGWCSEYAVFCKDPSCDKNHFILETIGV